jgi:hypothetical protein
VTCFVILGTGYAQLHTMPQLIAWPASRSPSSALQRGTNRAIQVLTGFLTVQISSALIVPDTQPPFDRTPCLLKWYACVCRCNARKEGVPSFCRRGYRVEDLLTYGIPSRKIPNSSSSFGVVANWQLLALSDLARRDCERQALDDVTP